MDDELDAALAAHDELVSRRGVEVWVGAEPTFTRVDSHEPAWLGDAEGGDKLERAQRLDDALTALTPGARTGRVLGRHFEGEAEPRFALGVRWSDARAVDVVGGKPPTFEELAGDHWATVTPDPGVVEVNLAPCGTAGALYTQSRRVWQAAEAAGLSPLRFRFNGEVADSGGGGQLSIGGSRPTASPFVRYPHVLPALVRYVNNTRRCRTGSRASARGRPRRGLAPMKAPANAGTSSASRSRGWSRGRTKVSSRPNSSGPRSRPCSSTGPATRIAPS